MPDPFIILSTQRSGSTVLVRSLDTHPEIFCAGEMFNVAKGMHHKEWFFGSWGISSKNNFIKKLNKIINYPNLKYNSPTHLNDFFDANEKGEKVRGFKLMRNQIKENPAILSYLEKHKVKVILLIRKNIFTNALSRFKMKETGVAHSSESGKKKRIVINPATLLDWMKKIENTNEVLIEYSEGMQRLIIYYEDFQEWDLLLKKIFSFLGVSNIILPAVLEKISSKNWRDEIKNFTEIEQAMPEKYAAFMV